MNILPQSPVVTAADFPRIFGEQDAKAGATYCPEMYFVRRADQVAYCQAYASVAGPTLTTRHFLSHAEGAVA